MIAFLGKASTKKFYVDRVKQHRKADEIVQGTYWAKGKGCAVGCTIHGNDHRKYETELGIPMVLARLQDRIFEGLPNRVAKDFPLEFLSAIRVGADLSDVWPKFVIWMLGDPKHGVIRFAKREETKKAIEEVVGLYMRREKDRAVIGAVRSRAYNAWRSAAAAAYADAAYAYAAADAAAADAAAYAAAAAAYAAAADADAAAAYAAAYAAAADAAAAAAAAADAAAYAAADAAAADAAADAADAAAYAAAYAADAAAYAAAYAAAADAAWRKACDKHYEVMASKLVELLKAA